MSFKVIDGGGPSKEQAEKKRALEFTEAELRHAAREAAANILRIIRGAGKSYEVLRQFSAVLRSAAAFEEIAGYWPTDIIANSLRFEGSHQSFMGLDRALLDRMSESGELDRKFSEDNIVRGALQIAASELVSQRTQRSAGESELYQGVNEIIEARRKSEAFYAKSRPAAKPSSKKKKKAKTAPRTIVF